MNPLTEQLVRHDLDDTRHLVEQAKGLPDDAFREPRIPGTTVLSWDGPEESVQAVLEHHHGADVVAALDVAHVVALDA